MTNNHVLLFFAFTFPSTTLSSWITGLSQGWLLGPFASIRVRPCAVNARFHSHTSLLLVVVSSDIIASKIAEKSSVKCSEITLFPFSECDDNYHFSWRKQPSCREVTFGSHPWPCTAQRTLGDIVHVTHAVHSRAKAEAGWSNCRLMPLSYCLNGAHECLFF